MTTNQSHLKQLYKLVETRLGLDIERRIHLNLDDVIQTIANGNLQSVLSRLQSEPLTAPIWQQLIDVLTIGETYFFRNQPQFQLLHNEIIPQVAKNRQQISIWCLGCATGEEAYSIAITLLETLPDLKKMHVSIMATDISSRAIALARKGFYREWSFRNQQTNKTFQQNYFYPAENGFQINQTIQKMVTFRQANLLDFQPGMSFDLILCRNVLLYFHEKAKQVAEAKLYQSLNKDGWLLLGHSEAIRYERNQWCTHVFPGVIAYQKIQPTQPTETFHYHRQLLSQPIQPLQRQPITSPQNNGDYQDAITAFHAKEHDHAETILAGIIYEMPDYVEAKVLLAAVFASRGATPEAHAQLDNILSEHPLNADAHYLRGMLYLEKNEFTLAETALRAALYSQTRHPLAAFVLGNLRAQRGDLKRAYNLWQQARDAAKDAPPDKPLSPLNPRTASNFVALIQNLFDD